jgi:3-isopropylmalate/(R)-2-methylmalate dehydratase small subunit
MEAFKTFTGIIAPLDRSNVDTDAIIPKQYLKSIKRSGFGPNLFDDWRYLDNSDPVNGNASRGLNPDFVLNQTPYDKAEILLGRENFGCGSSREHAVWALSDFGFKVVLAPSFGDIFYSNSFKNGFLPVRLKEDEIDTLFNAVQSINGFKATINLEKQFVETQDRERYTFDIASGLKDRLLKGLDDIGLTMEYADEIREYEKSRAKITPWLFKEIRLHG